MNAINPAFAHKLAPLNAEREPTLKEAMMEALLAEHVEQLFNDSGEWTGPEDDRDIRLHRATVEARDALYAAFARHGIDKALADRIGRCL